MRIGVVVLIVAAACAVTAVFSRAPTPAPAPVLQVVANPTLPTIAAPAQPAPAAVPVVSPAVLEKLRACLPIDDMTKERLDCYDAVVIPQPRANQPAAKIVTDCRILKEEDERLGCFNRFIERPKTAAAPKPVAPSPVAIPYYPHRATYVRRGRGGCGSRGGAGYRLSNGKCAGRRH